MAQPTYIILIKSCVLTRLLIEKRANSSSWTILWDLILQKAKYECNLYKNTNL